MAEAPTDPSHPAAFWDARYAEPAYAYGEEPNAWLVRQSERLPTEGAALVPAAGEGRDAVWLAQRGLRVTAVDLSREGLAKTGRLAASRGVEVETVHADLQDWTWPVEGVDVVALSFVHASPLFRAEMHRRAAGALAPGGLLVIEGFHVGQLVYREVSGGPPRADMLFTADLLREDFAGLEVAELEEAETVLREGIYHDGPAHVVQGVFRKA